ncbi:uncharacterized protein HGUI_01125 [Hanseniaspora guilliermondii]|uniref:SAM domain-containing protein n=1 Tax=Hanseniaspora guilliermondii TaxID=56406 RepID=A0A1L0CJF4_9ASCO|nr:uncharacterized protein HGUI_01125 [Hanseniaspora guilliermondii]
MGFTIKQYLKKNTDNKQHVDNDNILHSPRQHPGAVLLGNSLASVDMGMIDSFSNNLNLSTVGSNISNMNMYDNNGFFNKSYQSEDRISVTNDEMHQNQHRGSMVVNFSKDLSNFIHWINSLNPAEQNNVIDNLLPSLSEDVLQYTKIKLDSLTKTGYLSPTNIGSPVFNNINRFDMNDDVMSLNNDYAIAATMSAPQLTNMIPNANMLQAVHSNPHNMVSQNTYENMQMNSLDYLMGQPSDEDTISRVNSSNMNLTPKNSKQVNTIHDFLQGPSNMVEPKSVSPRPASFNLDSNMVLNNRNNTMASPKRTKSPQPTGNSHNVMTPEILCQRELLEDIPAWLKKLRLHKYRSNLEMYTWKEMIEFDDNKLEQLGVSALGARNKLLKAFNIVKENGIK